MEFDTDVQLQLLAWFDHHQRPMPWRQHPTPWGILVSEILLQQTQVSRATMYWESIMERFPTPLDMAQADVDEVLLLWQGAGYYSRGRRLHELSTLVTQSNTDFPHMIPSTLTELLDLPGIGPYTAAAVSSIAFGQPHACVDGNIRRVMARVEARESPTPSEVQAWADHMLFLERPGDWNQALMELGATICTPKKPHCKACPIASSCQGQAHPTLYPLPRSRRSKEVLYEVRVAFDSNGFPLLVQRQNHGLYAGLWGFELIELQVEPEMEGSDILGTVHHTLSHRLMKIFVRQIPPLVDAEGVDPTSVPMSNLDLKILNFVHHLNGHAA